MVVASKGRRGGGRGGNRGQKVTEEVKGTDGGGGGVGHKAAVMSYSSTSAAVQACQSLRGEPGCEPSKATEPEEDMLM